MVPHLDNHQAMVIGAMTHNAVESTGMSHHQVRLRVCFLFTLLEGQAGIR
jgi:hypothetical protein